MSIFFLKKKGAYTIKYICYLKKQTSYCIHLLAQINKKACTSSKADTPATLNLKEPKRCMQELDEMHIKAATPQVDVIAKSDKRPN